MLKRFIYIFCICFLWLLSITGTAQNKDISALVNRVLKKPDFRAQQVLLLKLNDSIWKKNDIKSQFFFLNEIARLSNQNKNFDLESQAYISLGNVHNNIGRCSQAIIYFQKAKKYFEKIGDNPALSTTYINMGNSYYYLGETDKALENYNKSLAKLKAVKVGDENTELRFSNIYNNLGTMYCIRDDYKTGLVYFRKSLLISEKLKDSLSIAYSYNNLSRVFMETGAKDSGFIYLKKSFSIKLRHGDDLDKSDATRNLSVYYSKEGDYATALSYAKKSLSYCDTTVFTEQLMTSYNDISEGYAKIHDAKNELKYFKLYIAARDSLDTQDQIADIKRKEMIFDFDKVHVTDSIKAVEEIKLKDLKLNQKKKESYYLFIALALMIIALGAIYNRFKITKKQKGVIEEQKILVDVKNKEIIESINYAKRLQDGILPSEKQIRQYFPESFVFYKPKDIIAGDFYWMEATNSETLLIAAADCTGHGVPGAMMSVACNNALHRAVNEFNLSEPGKILDKVRQLIIANFSKSESAIMDGMDISLMSVSYRTKRIQWSGANNRLLYIYENNLLELKPDKQPIGASDKQNPFTTHDIPFQKGSTFYLFSDGILDQFGGDKGKKYGISNFKKLIEENKGKTLVEQSQLIETTFSEWKKNAEQVDDVTILGLKI